MKAWPPRDWRMLLALIFLAGGGMAATLLAGASLYAIAALPWPMMVAPLRIRWLGYLGAGCLSLHGVALTGFATVLGRRSWKLQAGPIDASAEGGQDDPAAGVSA